MIINCLKFICIVRINLEDRDNPGLP